MSSDRGDRAVRDVRSDRGDRPDREPRGERDRVERPVRADRPERRDDRGDRTERAPREDRGGERRDRRPVFDDVGEGLEVGKLYRSKVVSIKDFGAFVEFLPGREGLVHVSELANFRVKQVEDIVQVGDEITVKLLGVDDKGRVRLSRRAAIEDRERSEGGDKREAPADEPADDDRGRRNDRFED